MTWIMSNLGLILLVGLIAFLVSFWWPKERSLRLFLRTLGAVVVLIVVVCVVYVMLSPPGGEDTVDDDKRPKPPTPNSRLEPLRLTWDSEGIADWPVAELLASMSEAAYLPPVDADTTFHKMGFEKVMPVVDASMIGYVISVDDLTVIVFRGTDNNIDWIVNLVSSSKSTPHGTIHKGFSNAYDPLKPQIVKVLSGSKPKHLWVTGHSLGGALAVVCAYDLIENEKMKVDGVITFGQPMVAHQQLANYLNNDETLLRRYAHYVNDNDIVPKIPPGYSHCGSLVWFTAEGVKRSKPKQKMFATTATDEPTPDQVDEITPLSEREFERLKAGLKTKRAKASRFPDDKIEGSSPYIRDHSMALYLEKIRSIGGNIGSK